MPPLYKVVPDLAAKDQALGYLEFMSGKKYVRSWEGQLEFVSSLAVKTSPLSSTGVAMKGPKKEELDILKVEKKIIIEKKPKKRKLPKKTAARFLAEFEDR